MYYIIDTAYHRYEETSSKGYALARLAVFERGVVFNAEGKTFKDSSAHPAEIAMWHEFCFGQ